MITVDVAAVTMELSIQIVLRVSPETNIKINMP